jgi:hypothetical protein
MRELLIDIVRSDFSEPCKTRLCALNHNEWENLFAVATKTKIFALLFQCTKELLPKTISAQFEERYAKHLQRVENQIEVLQKISAVCAQENLRYVLLKGLALSHLVYGDFTTRQSGDMDIIVDAKDLTRCDYVMRSCGLYQPDWSIGQALQSRKISQFLQFQKRESLPYPSKRKAHDNQLAPYYSNERQLKVEVHDGFAHIAPDYIRKMLWMTSVIDAGGKVRVLDKEHTFLCLLVTAYENSETFYACIDNELNLRDYIDIHSYLHNQALKPNWGKIADLIERLDLKEIVSVVHANYQDVYGHREESLEFLAGEAAALPAYGSNFLDRVFSPEYCQHLAVQKLREKVRSLIASNDGYGLVQDGPAVWHIYENPLGLAISYGISLDGESIKLSWRIPENMAEDISMFGLQVALLPGFESDHLEYLICISHDKDGMPAATLQTAVRLLQRFGVRDQKALLECRRETVSGFLIEEAAVPFAKLGYNRACFKRGAGILPTVFVLISPNLYHSICEKEDEFIVINEAFYI